LPPWVIAAKALLWSSKWHQGGRQPTPAEKQTAKYILGIPGNSGELEENFFDRGVFRGHFLEEMEGGKWERTTCEGNTVQTHKWGTGTMSAGQVYI